MAKSRSCLTLLLDSRKNSNTAQPTITGREKARLAALWKGLVCRMYDIDNRKFVESGDKWVISKPGRRRTMGSRVVPRICGIRHLQDSPAR